MKSVWLVTLQQEPQFDPNYRDDPVDWEFYLECTTGDQKGEIIYVTFTGLIEEDGGVLPWPEETVAKRMRAMASGLMREDDE